MSLLKLFGQYLIEKIVERTGAAFHWPTNFTWPPVSDPGDNGHHHHHGHHDEQYKLFPSDHMHDLHM